MRSFLAAAALGVTAATVALAPAPALAQAPVSIPLRVSAGDTFLLNGRISSEVQGGGEAMAGFDFTGSYVMAIEVLEANSTGGRWRWTFESFALDDLPLPEGEQIVLGAGFNEMFSAAVRLGTDIGFECRVDLTGACVELTNWPDWRERVENLALMGAGAVQMAGAFTPPGATDGKPKQGANDEPARIARVIRSVTGILLDGIDSRTAAGMMAMPMVTGLQGVRAPVGAANSITDSYAMPFGADPVTFTGTMTLESVNRGAGTAVVSRRVALDEMGLKASLATMLQNLSQPLAAAVAPVIPAEPGQDPVAAAAFGINMGAAVLQSIGINYVEETRGVVDLQTGLMRSADTVVTYTVTPPDGAQPLTTRTTMSFTLAPGAPPRPRLGAGAQ